MSQRPNKLSIKKVIQVPKALSARPFNPAIIKNNPKGLIGSKFTNVKQLRHPPAGKAAGSSVKQLGPKSGAAGTKPAILGKSANKLQTAKGTREQEDAKFRVQVRKEITWRFRMCAHRGYECTLPVLHRREYCARHILEDASAPYRQCAFNYPSGRKCPLPTPIQADTGRRETGLCFEHARAALTSRQRSTAPPPPITTTETLLNRLQHYVRPERVRTVSCASAVSVVSDPADQDLPSQPHPIDPFKQIDAPAVNEGVWTGLMECCTDSDSDADSVTLGAGGSARGGPEEDTSGDEETPYDGHPLRHAGVFTVEESVGEARAALRTLQAAYLRQVGRLRTLLQAARAQYIRQLRQEKELHCSINTQARNGQLSVRDRTQLRKLKAYAGFHRKYGVHAVLARKLHHKRAKAVPSGRDPKPAQGKCTFSDAGVRCLGQSVPAAKYCLKHLVHDHNQVLFSKCGDTRAGLVCLEPVAALAVTGLGCRYHTRPPAYTVFTLTKDDSASDSEETHTATDVESQIEDYHEPQEGAAADELVSCSG